MLSFKVLSRLLEKYLKLFKVSGSTKLFLNQELCQDFQDNKPYWLILKCTKCNKKVIPIISQEVITPATRFCKECGSEKFYIEKQFDIEHLDTIYAIYSKDVSDIRKAMVRYNCVQRDRRTAAAQMTRQMQVTIGDISSEKTKATEKLLLKNNKLIF